MKIDEWMPEYQISASYSIRVASPPEKTYASLSAARFSDLPVLRALMRLRGYRLDNDSPPTPAAKQSSGIGGAFLELVAEPPQEIVFGIVGRFWRPNGGLVTGLSPAQFTEFRREGYARAVWNFSIVREGTGSHLTTETRVQTFGRATALLFRLYWLIVGPFSGLIRKAMLREIKRIAEHTAA